MSCRAMISLSGFPWARRWRGRKIGCALVFHLGQTLIAEGIRGRMLDAMTVVAVSLVAVIEMFLLSSFLASRAAPGMEDEGSDPGRLARPTLFGFLLIWALPLSFLPIYTCSLMGVAEQALPQNLLLALPLTLEMAFGLLATLTAGGRIAGGWQHPTLLGLRSSRWVGALCALAENLQFLALARSIVGFSYGFTWMGLQGFVITRSSERGAETRHDRPHRRAPIGRSHDAPAVSGHFRPDAPAYESAVGFPARRTHRSGRGPGVFPGNPVLFGKPGFWLAAPGQRRALFRGANRIALLRLATLPGVARHPRPPTSGAC
jgi:hypothetical protein